MFIVHGNEMRVETILRSRRTTQLIGRGESTGGMIFAVHLSLAMLCLSDDDRMPPPPSVALPPSFASNNICLLRHPID